MANENRNLVLILLVLAMFTGMAVELREGSTTVGVLLFLSSVLLLTRIDKDLGDIGDLSLLKDSKIRFIVGISIVLAGLLYNLKNGSELGTLDVMSVFFGLSLVGTRSHNVNTARISRFGMYVSSFFTIMYLIFYTMFSLLNIKVMNLFDHYLILLPTVRILGLAGIPLEVIDMETVLVSGIEEIIIVINGPCSGLYSMFLYFGIVFAYSKIEKVDINRTLKMFGLCALIAYISNLFRIMVIFLTAHLYGQEVMMAVHTHMGWMIFVVVALLIRVIIKNIFTL